jgi:hypothetical protein
MTQVVAAPGTGSDHPAEIPIKSLTPPGSEPAQTSTEIGLADRLPIIAGIIAPTTLVAALLYYFGYVTTYARYAYFGLDLDQIGLSQQDLILRSVAALFAPAGALLLLGILGAACRLFLLRMTAPGRAGEGRLRTGLLVASAAAAVLGLVVFGRGMLGVVVPSVSQHEPMATSPVCLGGGALLTATGIWVHQRLRAATSTDLRVARLLWLLVWLVVALGLFWTTNSIAGAYGRAQAARFVATLPERPQVVVDTTERLYVPGLREASLPPDADQRYRYRYRDLRLLVASDRQLFLVPMDWRPDSGAVLILPQGDTVRIHIGT